MVTLNPAQSANCAAHKGRLRHGYDADLLIFDASLRLQATLCRGKVAFANEEWRQRLAGTTQASETLERGVITTLPSLQYVSHPKPNAERATDAPMCMLQCHTEAHPSDK